MSTFVQRPIGHMPFPGHRTQAQVRQDDEAREVMREQRRHQAVANSYSPPEPYDHIAWCPEAYKDAYREIRRKHVPAAQARPMIEAQMQADARREALR